jgi:hypothetical protein
MDNILIGAKQLKSVKWFKDVFRKRYKIKDLGEVTKILRVRVIRNRKNKTLTMDQSHYT